MEFIPGWPLTVLHLRSYRAVGLLIMKMIEALSELVRYKLAHRNDVRFSDHFMDI